MEQYKTDFSGFVYVRLEGAAIPIVEDGPEIVYMPKAGDHVVVPAGPHSIKPKQFSMLKDGTDVELTVSDIPLSMMQETVRLITERLRKNGSVRIEVEVYESAMKIGKITQFEERHVQKDGYLTYKITFPFRITGSSPLCLHGENQRRCPICKAFKEGSEAGHLPVRGPNRRHRRHESSPEFGRVAGSGDAQLLRHACARGILCVLPAGRRAAADKPDKSYADALPAGAVGRVPG